MIFSSIFPRQQKGESLATFKIKLEYHMKGMMWFSYLKEEEAGQGDCCYDLAFLCSHLYV